MGCGFSWVHSMNQCCVETSSVSHSLPWPAGTLFWNTNFKPELSHSLFSLSRYPKACRSVLRHGNAVVIEPKLLFHSAGSIFWTGFLARFRNIAYSHPRPLHTVSAPLIARRDLTSLGIYPLWLPGGTLSISIEWKMHKLARGLPSLRVQCHCPNPFAWIPEPWSLNPTR